MLFYIFAAINHKLLLDVATSTFNTTAELEILKDAVENSWLTVVGGDKGEWGMRRAHYLPNNSSIILSWISFRRAVLRKTPVLPNLYLYIDKEPKPYSTNLCSIMYEDIIIMLFDDNYIS